MRHKERLLGLHDHTTDEFLFTPHMMSMVIMFTFSTNLTNLFFRDKRFNISHPSVDFLVMITLHSLRRSTSQLTFDLIQESLQLQRKSY
jgi:hypothetical protein